MKQSSKSSVTAHTRVKENPGEFRVEDDVLFCNFCDHSIDWTRKSTVSDHLKSKAHISKKAFYENKQKNRQQTINFSASELKKGIIHDLVEAFIVADILLEKVNSLLPFFKKHCKEGG